MKTCTPKNTHPKDSRVYNTKATRMYGMTYTYMAWKWGRTSSTYYNLHLRGELKEFLLHPTKQLPKHNHIIKKKYKSFAYAPEFYVQRQIILKVYNKVCQICGKPAKIAHHKDSNKNNNSFKNLMLVCYECHHLIHRVDIKIGHMDRKFRRRGFI